jgi:hypothetical protein
VKFLRFLLSCLTLALMLAALLAILAFVPAVQTWVAQMALAKAPDLKGSLGSLTAGFGQVDLEGLHLEVDGAVLTLPSLQAALPLTTAARQRTLVIRRVVAKGWTLDLSHRAAAGETPAPIVPPAASEGAVGSGATAAAEPPAPAPDVSAQRVAAIVHGLLSEWTLPCDVSLDGVDLEGDVLAPASPGGSSAKVHVTIQGGGLAAGHEGTFTIEASSEVVDSGFAVNTVAAHGRLVVAMESPRKLKRIEVVTNLSAQGGFFPEDLDLSANAAAARGADGETYTLDLNRGSRRVATFLAHYPPGARQLAGTWQVDLQDADLAPFFPGHPLPSFAAAGTGRWESDAAFQQVHASGGLKIAASHGELLAPLLGRLGAVTLDTGFAFTRRGQTIRVDRLDVSLAGARPIATLHSLQPFDFDGGTRALRPTDPHGDWMDLAILRLPLAWLSDLTGGLALSGSDVTGAFVAQPAEGGFLLRPKTPLTAAGVSVESGGRVLAQGLDLSLSLLADSTTQGWQVQAAPLTVASGGQRLATIEAKASSAAGADQAVTLAGTWRADLEALAGMPGVSGRRWIAGRSASGDFTATVGASPVVDGNLVIVGHAPDHSITASVQSSVDADGGISFLAPIKMAFGPNASELSAEGSWTGTETGPQVVVKVTGQEVSLEQLRLLVAPVAAAAGLHSRPFAVSAVRRDRIPFWGSLAGTVTLGIDRLHTPKGEFKSVGGTFELAHQSLRLEHGHTELPSHSLATAEGTLIFDPASPFPYRLQAVAGVDKVEAAPWFATAQFGQDPLLEGRFAVAAKLTGSGGNLDDLVGRAQEEFHLTSNGGIFRMLKTSVAESIPEVATPMKDALGTAGSVMGSLFGHKGYSIDNGKNPVSPIADAVLDFTSQVQEISYDELTVVATRMPDGTIHLSEIAMTTPDERLTGSGQIGWIPGRPFPTQPFGADLQLGFHGRIAGLLKTAGLLSPRPDDPGYTMLRSSVHFGGTLDHVDESQWHDLLAKAATQKPAGAK